MSLFERHLPKSVVEGLAFPGFPAPAGSQVLALHAQLQATQWWPLERLRAHQLRQLELLVQHAARTTDWGRQHFPELAEGGLDWESFRQLPILTRDQLQRTPEQLRSRQPLRSHGPVSIARSSGSTSTPIAVDRAAITGMIWHAINHRDHSWHRRDVCSTLATVRHALDAPPPDGAEHPAWGPLLGSLGLTGPCHHLHVEATTAQQLAWLKRRAPDYLHCYPSSLSDLLDASPERPVPNLRAVLTFGEVVEPALRERLQKAWRVPLQDTYSAQEVGYIALQCPEHAHYHLQSEVVLTEVVDADGRPCAPGERGRVLVTPLHGFAMPLIRYELGDLGVLGTSCSCGRGLPVLERIDGRIHQTFVTGSGERLWLTVGVHLFPSLAPVRQHQFVQRAPGTLEARFVAHREPTPAETEALRAHLASRLPAGTTLTVRWVERIDRQPSGKFLSFVSALTS